MTESVVALCVVCQRQARKFTARYVPELDITVHDVECHGDTETVNTEKMFKSTVGNKVVSVDVFSGNSAMPNAPEKPKVVVAPVAEIIKPAAAGVIELPKKALSVHQPWVWAMLNAGKPLENRDWSTQFRGPFCLHASKGGTKRDFESDREFILKVSGADNMPAGWKDYDKGGIVATAEIVDCITESDSPWFFGTFGFVLENIQPVDFIPVKGKLGFFNWEKTSDIAKPEAIKPVTTKTGDLFA